MSNRIGRRSVISVAGLAACIAFWPALEVRAQETIKFGTALSLTGNLAELKGENILHLHGVFCRHDLSTFCGHVFSLRVSGACEIYLTTFSTPFTRTFDEETGLNLLRGQSV